MKIAKTTIPLGFILAKRTKEIAAEKNGRIQNWRESIPSLDGRIGTIHSYNCGRYSRRCTFTKYEYAASVRSWGAILPNGDLVGLISKEKFRLRPFRGYKWETDSNGVKLVSISRKDDDYHPNSNDIESGMRHIIGKLKENAAVRLENMRAMRLEKMKDNDVIAKAHKLGVKVTLADSILAGNCKFGTLQFCRNHGFNPDKSYTPEKILAQSNGDTQRARLAIHQAIRWHDKVKSLGGEVFYP